MPHVQETIVNDRVIAYAVLFNRPVKAVISVLEQQVCFFSLRGKRPPCSCMDLEGVLSAFETCARLSTPLSIGTNLSSIIISVVKVGVSLEKLVDLYNFSCS